VVFPRSFTSAFAFAPSWLLAGLLPAVGLGELSVSIWQRRQAPAAEEWASLRTTLGDLRREGDVIVVAPGWAEPHARQALGDAFFPLSMVARADDSRPTRALVVVSAGHRIQEAGLDPRFFPVSAVGSAQPTLRALTPHLSLAVLENAHPHTIVGDLLDHVTPAELRVSRRQGETNYPCTYTEQVPAIAGGLFAAAALPKRRWLCLDDRRERDPSLQGVALSVQEDETFRPRRCLLTPIGAGVDERTVVETSAVPLGRFLTGHAGVYWTRQRERHGADVLLEVFLDDRSVGHFTFAEGTGFRPFELDLGAVDESAGTLRFELRTADGTARPFCLEAVTRRAGWERIVR
jgi:hypothetical protein